MTFRLQELNLIEQAVLALSCVLIGFLLIDPFVLERVKGLPPDVRSLFKTFTNLGRSNWMLIPTGAAVALALVLRRTHQGLRNAAAHGLIASTIGFVFVSVGGAGLIATLVKNIIGRARPKLFATGGPLDFQLFAFLPDHASFPSGHATNIFALATVIAILWPRARVLLYTAAAWVAASRVLIGVHYFTDAVVGAIFGGLFPYWVRDRFARGGGCSSGRPAGGIACAGPALSGGSAGPRGSRSSRRGPSKAVHKPRFRAYILGVAPSDR